MINDYHCPEHEFVLCTTPSDRENETLFIGAELEVENRGSEYNEEIAQYIDSNYSHLELNFENDSSLDSGFEIITQPQSKKCWYHRKNDYKKIFEYLQENNFVSHDTSTCGLHFHISRKYFGETEEEQEKYINKMLTFFEFYKQEVLTISRRKNNLRWCNFLITLNEYEKLKTSPKYLGEFSKQYRDRYRVVNLTNSETVEIRVFKGTLNFNTFWSDLEFIFSLLDFIKSNKKITFSKVVRNNDYKTLKKYAEEKNLYNDTPLVDNTKYLDLQVKKEKEVYKKLNNELKGILRELSENFTKLIDTLNNNDIDNFTSILGNLQLALNVVSNEKSNLDLLMQNDYKRSINTNLANITSTLTYASKFDKKITDKVEKIKKDLQEGGEQ